MNKACYPGSFDPITNGHLDLIKRASKMFDSLDVLVAINPDKKSLFNNDEKVMMIKEAVKDLKNVNVNFYAGLVVDYCKENDIKTIIRGLRNAVDFENELALEKINKELNPDIETIFLAATIGNIYISSSNVKELIKHKKDISKYVPKSVLKYLK